VVLYHDTSVNYATTLLLSAIAIVDNVYLVSCLLYQTGKAICYGTTVMIGLRSVYPQVSAIITCVPAMLAGETGSVLAVSVRVSVCLSVCPYKN